MSARYTRKLSLGYAFTREQQTIRRSNYEQRRHPRAGSLTICCLPVIADSKPAQMLHGIKIATKLFRLLAQESSEADHCNTDLCPLCLR